METLHARLEAAYNALRSQFPPQPLRQPLRIHILQRKGRKAGKGGAYHPQQILAPVKDALRLYLPPCRKVGIRCVDRGG